VLVLTYDNSECVSALLDVASQVDGKLSSTDYTENKSSDYPTRKTISENLGGWNKAKEFAGLETFNQDGKLDINESYFKDLDPESAYWLGFIFADGHVSNIFVLSISVHDENHLRQFKKDIESDHTITYNEYGKGDPMVRISTKIPEFIEPLKEYLGENKTKSNSVPQLPEHLFSHFIRGLFDGDGHAKKGHRTIVIAGSESRMERLSNILQFESDVFTADYYPEGHAQLKLYGNSAEKFANWAWNNPSRMLQRKKPDWI
jgi:hypothetical protein